ADLGRPSMPRKQIDRHTGRGVDALWVGLLEGEREALIRRAASRYREHYQASCGTGSQLYPGVEKLLAEVSAKKAVLTNKPLTFTKAILRALSIDDAFSAVVGGDEPGAKLKPDAWPVREALKRLRADAARALLVGDTESDVEA